MAQANSLSEQLKAFMPEAAVEQAVLWIRQYNIHLRISRSRKTKLGDYRPPHKNLGHRISVNHNLNPFAFLVTFVHEVAHLVTWEKYKRNVAPHGAEWKQSYRELMLPILEQDIFPDDLTEALQHYMTNPAAGSCSDTNLLRALRKYDEGPEHLTVESLEEGMLFVLKVRPNLLFKKGPKLRKRFKCQEINHHKTYLINPLAEVVLVTD